MESRSSYKRDEPMWWLIVQIVGALVVMGIILKWIIDNEKMAKRKIRCVEIKVKYYNGDYRMQILDVEDVFPLVKFQEKIIDLLIDVAIECKREKQKKSNA